jgi:L-amino acid N-acyltransferase YncA
MSENMLLEFSIERMASSDWTDVCRIYMEGVATGHATFQTAAPTWDGWNGGHLENPRLIARQDGQVLGWAALSSISSRPVYRGVTEVSVYVSETARHRRVGQALMEALIAASEEAGIWTLQSSIFPENIASVALHERNGFRLVGRRERIGQHYGVWRDTVLMERRSSRVAP